MALSHRPRSDDSSEDSTYESSHRPARIQIGNFVYYERGNRSVAFNKAKDNSCQSNSISGDRGTSSAQPPSTRPPSIPPRLLQPATLRRPLLTAFTSPRNTVEGTRPHQQLEDITDHDSQRSGSDADHSYPESSSDNESRAMSRSQRNSSSMVDKSHVTVRHVDNSKAATYDIKHLKLGSVITVVEEAAQISSRTFIIMAHTAENSLQCVSLCRHGELEPEQDDPFLDYHCKVYDEWTVEELKDHPDQKRHVKIDFTDPQANRLEGHCWVNCQHVFTVSKVGFRREGKVEKFTDFLGEFWKVQKRLYGKGKQDE